MASFFQRFSAYTSLITSSATDSFYDQMDFAVQRTNFQGNDAERHVYQSFRALKSFLSFAGFSTVSCTALGLTKIAGMKPHWKLDTHFKFCLMLGVSYVIFHRYCLSPLEVHHILTTPNSSFTQLAYSILQTREDKDLWMTAFNLPEKPTIEKDRLYFAVPNFQHSGNNAVICVNPTAPQYPSVQYSTIIEPLIPIDGIEIDGEEFFQDVANANALYISSKPTSPLTINGTYDENSAALLKKSIAAYCGMHDIPMPPYFAQFDSYNDNISIERPVNYLHMYKEDDKKVRGHLPLVFQSPADIVAVNKARQQLQDQVNQQAKEFFAGGGMNVNSDTIQGSNNNTTAEQSAQQQQV